MTIDRPSFSTPALFILILLLGNVRTQQTSEIRRKQPSVAVVPGTPAPASADASSELTETSDAGALFEKLQQMRQTIEREVASQEPQKQHLWRLRGCRLLARFQPSGK